MPARPSAPPRKTTPNTTSETTPETAEPLRAEVTLRRPSAGRAGADRVALLRAIRDTGALTAAAKRLGLSYKGAWDAVQVLNNLFERPLVEAAPGGREGGASRVTPAGEAVLAAYAAVEAELDAVVSRLESRLADERGAPLTPLLWGWNMRTSARNALRGEVERVVEGAVNSEVVLRLADGVHVTAVVTRESVEALGLAPGAPALALVKSSFVILARGEGLRTSARNQLAGRVLRREDGPVSTEVVLELPGGKTLTATLTRASADALELAPGVEATALIKASHVILAAE